ncbi:MAG: acyl carrier protein [Anaerolineae bacterium]|jgi:acyl carrier protein
MSTDTFERIRDIVAEELGLEKETIKPESSFREDLDADSLDLVELIMAFEEEFDCEIADEDAQKIQTVSDAVTYMEQRLA